MTKTIVIEDRLKEIFDDLPSMDGPNGQKFKVHFGFGDEFELKRFLDANANDVNRPYPLIWLVYPIVEHHSKKTVDVENLTFILAVNTSRDLSNSERLQSIFKKVLIPLQDNILNALRVSNTSRFSGEFQSVKFPNYSDDLSLGEANFTSERWDAIKLIINANFNSSCYRSVKK